ncbi:sulfite exporter TauE/SafE family protein [Echinicola jeungdonensis]|uniref:Probable membrane transporter protein n=1 Tax=Echinicola jeungdonensis TaxID=709343 RepID=A0ABV5J4K0_9BACT|nr:sulfite exporter TauE/SafE family protein [Echinicola jeungdonensis]MDN3670054.1 sulfite exporter TauE/SafE family protein [Echinicola jeungdonensis]
METITVLGYLASIFIGISLGLIGGGGSILTVPVLVYLFRVDPILATAYSLFVVGSTSVVGSFSFMKRGIVSYRAAIVFAVPSFIAVFLTRKFVVPALPEILLSFKGYDLTNDKGVMIFFALIMLAAAISMIKNGHQIQHASGPTKFNLPLIGLEGFVVGGITGIVGAGGGFLIIPALVLLAKLPMKIAVGTSLLIIAAKSLIGFTGDISNQPINWGFLLLFTSLSIIGIFLGSGLSKMIDEKALKKAFGWFVLVMGFYILINEIILV